MIKRKRKITKEKIKKPKTKLKEKFKEVKVQERVEKALESYDKDKVLRNAKVLKLFKHNKKYRQYEIIISLEEYEKI